MSRPLTISDATAFLQRAGLNKPSDAAVSVDDVSGGVSGADVYRIHTASVQSFVLKRVDDWPLWNQLTNTRPDALWSLGVLKHLPAPLTSPMLDVFSDEPVSQWIVVMQDVTQFLRNELNLDHFEFAPVQIALAKFHADNIGKGRTLCTRERRFELLTYPLLAATGQIQHRDGWQELSEAHQFTSEFVEGMVRQFGDANFETYLSICKNRHVWWRAAEDMPQTILHGDFKVQHLVPETPNRIHLLDWDSPYLGLPTDDVAYCCFHDFWCFPSYFHEDFDQDSAPFSPYLNELSRRLFGRRDSPDIAKMWHLSWLKIFVEMGWFLASPATRLAKPVDETFRRRRVGQAIDRANWILDRWA